MDRTELIKDPHSWLSYDEGVKVFSQSPTEVQCGYVTIRDTNLIGSQFGCRFLIHIINNLAIN